MSTLEIKDLHVHVETKEGIKPILKGATLTVHSGETHAIMGPNGSGKSTLAYTLAGHPKYVVDSGEALLDGKDILKMTPDERAKAGLFLAMQYRYSPVGQGPVRSHEAPQDGPEVRLPFRERRLLRR